MAGTLSYRLRVDHIYQRRFDSSSLAQALSSSHWYIITRRPSTKIIAESTAVGDGILTVDFLFREDFGASQRVQTLGSDFSPVGKIRGFHVHENGAYFSLYVDDQLIHGDAWALASLLSGAKMEIAKQEVLYIGQAFGQDGGSNAWKRTSDHKKLQRIYEDHVNADCEIFVAPLSLERKVWTGDDHIEDDEDGPSLDAYYDTLAFTDGRMRKTSIDLVEHSLISYFNPHYNEKLKEWQAGNPTDAMRKMRSAGFRLIHVHLSGWWGLARFYSAQEPDAIRSHFISHDIPPEPRRPVLRGISAEQLSEWRIDAMLVREGADFFADKAEQTGATLRIFGDEAPIVRKPPGVQLFAAHETKMSNLVNNTKAHGEIRAAILARREEERKANEPLEHSGKSSYDPETGTIKVGVYEDGDTERCVLHDPGTGYVNSVLIIGEPGMGKSNHLRVLTLEALLTERFFVIPSDPSGKNNLRRKWRGVCEDHYFAEDLEETVANLQAACRIIDSRYRENNYSQPSREIPGIIFPIDDADSVLQDARGLRLVEKILATGGKVGVGLFIVAANIFAMEANPAIIHTLMSCEIKTAFATNGYFVLADLQARYGEPRPSTWNAESLSMLLYTSKKDAVLGFLAAATSCELSPADACEWADGLLGANSMPEVGRKLAPWKMVDGDPRSWWTLDLLEACRWYIRRNNDAWALVRVIANFPPIGTTRNADMLEWAIGAIGNRFTVDLAKWRIGPSTGEKGLSALYVDVKGSIVGKDRSESIKQLIFGLR
ncbi:hypothetical protein [Kutzneria sp. NPDC052558]|uniref:hypothetical protein n=1 Tax=Kutzneria sp. NPDC052558 TaxID=3364121 RepID=UPI0037C616A5